MERATIEPERRIEVLERTHELDHRSPELRAAADTVADERIAVGRAARAAEDWETAYHAFSDALRVDPSRSWARRYAEKAGTRRLQADSEP